MMPNDTQNKTSIHDLPRIPLREIDRGGYSVWGLIGIILIIFMWVCWGIRHVRIIP